MKRFVACFALVLLARPVVAQARLVLLGDVVLPMPIGWSLVDTAQGFPYLIVSDDGTAELTIHRSTITGDDIISNNDEFRISVDSVIAGVVMGLPEVHMVSNTGLRDGPWASFALEFEAWDEEALSDLHHRLTGVLYLHPDGYQLLFTLWARALPVVWPVFSDDLLLMQDGFVYTGPAEDSAFGSPTQESNLLFLLLPLMIIAFVQTLRRSVRRKRMARAT